MRGIIGRLAALLFDHALLTCRDNFVQGERGMSAHKQALCDNIDAWTMWLSPPIFLTFNLVYWIAYRHVETTAFD